MAIDTSYRDQFSDPLSSAHDTKNQAKGTDNSNKVFNAVFADEKDNSVSVDDFLQLMIAQLRNQDFTNPVDDTQYVTQLAQFATMKSMEELASYSKANYVMSLAGKNVTAAKFNVNGDVDKETGIVERISLLDEEYKIYVGGKAFSLDQIMEINGVAAIPDKEGSVDPSNLAVKAQVNGDTVDLSWPAPTTDSATQEKLKYVVYYSESKAMDTLEEVEANGIPLSSTEGEKGKLSETIKGLKPDKEYFANVVVIDEAGSRKVYQKAAFRTAAAV